jgi:hypothetical protein
MARLSDAERHRMERTARYNGYSREALEDAVEMMTSKWHGAADELRAQRLVVRTAEAREVETKRALLLVDHERHVLLAENARLVVLLDAEVGQRSGPGRSEDTQRTADEVEHIVVSGRQNGKNAAIRAWLKRDQPAYSGPDPMDEPVVPVTEADLRIGEEAAEAEWSEAGEIPPDGTEWSPSDWPQVLTVEPSAVETLAQAVLDGRVHLDDRTGRIVVEGGH